MFKSTLAALATLLMFMGSTAFAGGVGKGNECDPQKVAGSYIAFRPLLDYQGSSGPGVLDQLKLGSDGTAYWYENIAFDQPIHTGSFIPEIGSWKCQKDGTLVVTTIGAQYNGTGADLVKFSNHRFTQKLSVVDSNTLQNISRVARDFALTDNPLGPLGIASLPNPDPFQYIRVKPLPSDIP